MARRTILKGRILISNDCRSGASLQRSASLVEITQIVFSLNYLFSEHDISSLVYFQSMTYLDKVTCLSVTMPKVNNILQECKQFKEILTFHFQFSQEMIICADCEKSLSTYVNSEKSFTFSASKLPNTIDFVGLNIF